MSNDTGTPGWQQTNRLLTLTTPLGKNTLLAETLELNEALGPVTDHAGFHMVISVLSPDAALDLTQLLGQPARLDVQTAYSRTEGRPCHGHVTRVVRQGANGGFARYRLTIEPWLAFLGHNRDAYLFQNKSVIEIVDELFESWKEKGKLVPAWEWRLADRSLYLKRGLTTQYGESDLAFLKRLLAEEGLFTWFEHKADQGAALGSHTLIIADHNGAFTANRQANIRFTQAGATLSEDSLDRWAGLRQIDTSETQASSWDYRSLGARPQAASSAIDNGSLPKTTAWFDPGQYAWVNGAHGERLIGNQRQAIDARLKQFHGAGTVRTAAPGTTFTLADHPEHDRDPAEQRQFLITQVTHRARNNLSADLPGSPEPLATGNPKKTAKSKNETDPETTDIDYYRVELSAIRATIAWRPLLDDGHGRQIHPRPTVSGSQTAIVLGDGNPSTTTHTDRDYRIRVQFPWQRGSKSATRSAHPSGDDNSPANRDLGVWIRVLSPVAGANWGGQLLPRPGQEVLVAFLHGNIDRPVIVGALYNGQGQPDAQSNQIAGTTQDATANAPAYFAGKSDPAHTHHASLSGIKTQQRADSRSGQGGYNQLTFDDTPGESRIQLATTQYQSSLQLGHLKQQNDNARQKNRGHGGELATQASLALRAGNGLLLSSDARPNASSTHLDSREAIAQVQDAKSLTQSLADVAAKQNAALKGDPGAEQLPVTQAWDHAEKVLSATATQGGTDNAEQGGHIKATQGGTGTIPAWSEPRLHYAAPAGIAQLTPKDHILVAGKNLAIATGHDTNLLAQGQYSLAVKDGLTLFTVGKASNKQKPNSETGIHLHAASGQVSLQSQSGKTLAAADKKVTLASSTANLNASAKQKILATAQGAYLKIEGGNIELHAPNKVEFKASSKNWTGPASASADGLVLPKAKDLYDEQFVLRDKQSLEPIAGAPYKIVDAAGKQLFSGIADEKGQTVRLTFANPEKLKLLWGK